MKRKPVGIKAKVGSKKNKVHKKVDMVVNQVILK